jgi:alpha-tubulin suppressor-like RCC1 family protein
VLTDQGHVYSWGENSNGELGLTDFRMRTAPHKIQSLDKDLITSVSCGYQFTVALGQTLQRKP